MRGLALLFALVACHRPAASSSTQPPIASTSAAPSASASPCAFDAARVADVRAKVKTLKPGMSRAEVDRVLALDYSCFSGSGQGSPQNFAVAYGIAPGVTLAFTWERKGDAGDVLVSADVKP